MRRPATFIIPDIYDRDGIRSGLRAERWGETANLVGQCRTVLSRNRRDAESHQSRRRARGVAGTWPRTNVVAGSNGGLDEHRTTTPNVALANFRPCTVPTPLSDCGIRLHILPHRLDSFNAMIQLGKLHIRSKTNICPRETYSTLIFRHWFVDLMCLLITVSSVPQLMLEGTNTFVCFKNGRQGGRQPLFSIKNASTPNGPASSCTSSCTPWGSSRADTPRPDDFIDVLWSNIAPDHQDNFAKVNQRLVGIYDAPYDYAQSCTTGQLLRCQLYHPTIIPKTH
ncbi:hypothetical protein BV898_14567 [Hypsibius exemplaris]|uniref:Peptidase M12A domain-containing protein n=1 Tax=Hypsibius exemplaris TaxID=2072580 RepID=A0A9X6NG42_HYPEX|nr:hypothetical protein BV898_14567 [Hypsibius exemplaris]